MRKNQLNELNMDQFVSSHKLATYLHPGPSGPFLELNNEPMKPPSPSTSALLQHNPSLIDICKLNSICQRFVENSTLSTSSPYKSCANSSNLYFSSSSVAQVEYPPQSNDLNTKQNTAVEAIASPISSAGDCSPNVSSYNSTPYSSPRIHTANSRSSDSTKTSDKSSTSVVDNQYDDHKIVQQVIAKTAHASPILHRLLTTPSKPLEKAQLSNQTNHIDHESTNSPQHQSQHSPEFKLIPKDNLNKNRKTSDRSNNSPECVKPKADQKKQTVPTADNNNSNLQSKPSITSTTTASLDKHESNKNGSSSSTTVPNNKRPLESTEQVSTKRQHTDGEPTIFVQSDYCVSYPDNIPRCVDCQTANPHDVAMHLTSCRFQHCRIMKQLNDATYEIEGFTTPMEAKPEDAEYLCTPNSSGQPALNSSDAHFIFKHIAKIFCLMFLHEQSEQSAKNEKNIIRKKYMTGWREVCDECLTTLFNYHYICTECGYAICIECSRQLSQLSAEKRKKLQRFCPHENSFCLTEFIPWNMLVKLRNDVMDHLSRLQLDRSIKLYQTSRTESLSAFIKSIKFRRSYDARDVKKVWSPADCNYDANIEFFCNGRLPVFNEWTSDNAKEFFRKVWSSSCPVLVRRVQDKLSNKLWEPTAFKEHMIDHQETPALWDCETLAPIPTDETILRRFWDGFERLDIRLTDDEHGGRPRILKLKDWPTKRDFASIFPTLLHDLMNNIPFSDYTRRSYTYENTQYAAGPMNIVERLPSYFVRPDLGPKLYIAYSQLTSQATRQAGTTNLHIDVADAVNVLVYVGIGGHGDDGLNKEEEMRRVEAEILTSKIDEAQLQRLRNGERPGALWHLFRSDDAKKIREYVGRDQRKSAGSDTIHDQTAYLEQDDLDKLREWSKVESYPILQFFGDAVFIPSGAPHQVKNLHSCIKIAEDFVSPENLDRCLVTANEFRSLSATHSNHADILQAKNILYYAMRDVLDSLNQSNKTAESS